MSLLSLRRVAGTLLFAAAISISSSPAYAATANARIKGSVTDPSGAVVANATVTAVNTATGVKYNTISSSDGAYLFPALPIGTYSISVTAPGFKSFTATGIILNIDQEYVETAKLALGATTETMEVAADAVQVNTTDMQLSNIVNSSQMVELPLIGRNFTGLELIEPGVQASNDRFGTYSVSGAETQQSEFLINGADSNDIALNTLAISPNLDAIDQFNLIEGPLNAEYDRNSGGIVSATIKQGTNHIHGDAFEFYRDTFLNTPNFFQTTVSSGAVIKKVTTYHQNIFGGTIGAPIIKDKLFGFAAYQGTRQVVPGTNGGGNTNVFNTAQRGGDFSADLTSTANPNGTNPVGYTFATANAIPAGITIGSCPGATTWAACIAKNGGVFKTSDFNPLAVKLLNQFVPTANSGSNGYVFDSTTKTSADQYIGRLDYSLNSKNQFTGLGIYQKQAVTSNIPFTGASLPGFGEVDAEHIQQYTFDYVAQLSATSVNDFALHYTRFNYAAVEPQSPTSPSAYGFSISPQNTGGESLPLISTGYFTLGFSNNGPQPRIDQVYQFDDTFSKSLGHHQLKFGYDGRRFNVSNPFSANNNGNYGYGAGAYTSGDPGLDFLIGNPSSYSQGSGATIQAEAFLNYLFVQDTWKVTDTFTLSYGLGYQIDTPLHNLQYGGEGIGCFIPGQQSKIFPSAPPSLNFPGDPGCTNAGSAYTRYGDFGPRIGFAYAPDLGFLSDGASKKLSIRGGFGIYYNRSEEETSLNNLETPPFGESSNGVKDYNQTAVPSFANPYVDNTLPATSTATGSQSKPYTNKFPFVFPAAGSSPNFALNEPFALNTYSRNFRSPYAENIELSVEREFPAKTIARVSYVASLGRHNQITYEGNPVTAAGHAACLADTTYCSSLSDSEYRDAQNYYFPGHTSYGNQMIDPNTGAPAFPSVGEVGAEGASSYNALQVSVNKALSHGLQFQLSYTFSHALDNSSSYENSGYGSSGRGYNQFQPSLNYGNSTYDARQRLVFSPIYVVPFKASGSAFGLYNLLLSGWQISAITTVSTGFPFDTSYNGSSSNAEYCPAGFTFYACPDQPNSTGSLIRGNTRVKSSNHTTWYVPSTFAVAQLGTFGNAARNSNHGPGLNNSNIVLAKNFPLGSDGVRRIQIRMESDNAFNHSQFSNPASGFGTQQVQDPNTLAYSTQLVTGTSGQITGVQQAARQTLLAAKFYF
jgi:hypothetical protein